MPRSAPRIDERLIRFIQGTTQLQSAAEITRAVGSLAWELGLARPSYEQVRVHLRDAPPQAKGFELEDLIGILYEYPAPLLGDWYDRYRRGEA